MPCRHVEQQGSQAGKLTYIEFREHSELVIITYIANRQTDIHIYMYLSTSDLTQELVKILSDLC